MIWLTWRQSRTQVSVIAAAVAALAVVLAATGPHLFDVHHLYASTFLDRINTSSIDRALYIVGVVLTNVAPAVIGAFWGAPLIAREFEAGTHRLIWNQSVTRTRWLATKLGMVMLAALVVTGLLSLAVTWWSSPIDASVGKGQSAGPFSLNRMYPLVFSARGVVPLGYAAFAVVLGVTIGLVLRRSVAALAITLVAVIAIQIAMPLVVRAHLIAPVRVTTAITMSNLRGLMIGAPEAELAGGNNLVPMRLHVEVGAAGDWHLTNQTIDTAGKVQEKLPAWVVACGGGPPPSGSQADQQRQTADQQACLTRLSDAGYRQVVTYQPASRFWGLQWRETGLFVVFTLLLTGFCFWRIRRDLS
jgi:ABC-type transport system involved in multi-copper enzyme maturation permease subunit